MKIFIYSHGYESGSGGVILAKDITEAQEKINKIYFGARVREAKPLKYLKGGELEACEDIFEVYDY